MDFKNKRESVLQEIGDNVDAEFAESQQYDKSDPDLAAFIRIESGRHQDRLEALKSVGETFWTQNLRHDSGYIETLIVEITGRSPKEWTQRTGLDAKPMFALHDRRIFERPIRLAAAVPLKTIEIDGLVLTRLDIAKIVNNRLNAAVIQQEAVVRLHVETLHGKIVTTCFLGYNKIHHPSIYNVLHTEGSFAHGRLLCFAVAGFGRIAVITSHDVDQYDLYKNFTYRSIEERMTTRLDENESFGLPFLTKKYD